MEYVEKRLDGEEKYKGVIVRVRLDRAELYNGRIVKREVVEHPGGVTVCPWTRTATATWCASSAIPSADDAGGARRQAMIDMGAMGTSPGFSTEVLHLYLAHGLHAGKAHPDEGEFLNVEKFRLEELVKMVMANEIDDGKTIAAILKADRYLRDRRA